MALTHVDESVRVEAAETLFLNPKTASLPSPLGLYLMKEAVPLNMRSSYTGFQMKWTSLFRDFFSQFCTSLEKQYKLGSRQPLKSDQNAVLQADSLFKFMRWLSSFLYLSCYPSAPYRRKIMATELIQIMIEVWPFVASKDPTSHQFLLICIQVKKIQREGVVPTVHAFNALKAVFNDTNLSTDTSGFSGISAILPPKT